MDYKRKNVKKKNVHDVYVFTLFQVFLLVLLSQKRCTSIGLDNFIANQKKV